MRSQKYYYYFLIKLKKKLFHFLFAIFLSTSLDSLFHAKLAQKILNGIYTRSLINIWIPSVFLSGNGNHGPGGAHYHVYQVYLRIRDEEWNIYR